MRATRLLFVRHGRTADNAEGRFQGQQGGGLDELGREQATRVAARLVARGPRALYTSDLQRARETADLLAVALGLPPRLEPRLREVDIGAWAGLTAGEVAQRFPAEHAAWREGRDAPRGGGETYEEVAARMAAAAAAVAGAHREETVVLVSHGAALRSLVCRVLGLPANSGRLWGLRNAAVAELAAPPSGLVLVAWNDASPGD